MITSDDAVYERKLEIDIGEDEIEIIGHGETERRTEAVIEGEKFIRHEHYGDVWWEWDGEGRVDSRHRLPFEEDNQMEILLEAIYQSRGNLSESHPDE